MNRRNLNTTTRPSVPVACPPRRPRLGRLVLAGLVAAALFTVPSGFAPSAIVPSAFAAPVVSPENTFPALGAPDDPKVEVAWNRFHDVEGLNDILRALARAYPDLTNLVSVGRSAQGREILSLEVTSKRVGDPALKPAMYVDGNIHGNEVQGGEAVAYTAWYLCEMYGKVDRVTRLLDEKAFYLIPTINPDGRDHWFHEANTPHSSRGGQIPIDNDQDGRFDEDPANDLDGDGWITRMRVKDPWGRWKADPEFPELLMVRVAEDERGEYSMLGWEGIDDDGDGEINEDGPGGYDINRNWAWNWGPEGVQNGAHWYPFSLPESRAVSDYVKARPNIAGSQSYHNAGGMILRGPGIEGGEVHPADERLGRFIAERGEKILPGYDALVVYKDLYSVYGGEFEWFYGGQGILSFTNELWTAKNLFRAGYGDDEDDDWEEGGRERARFQKYLLADQGVVPWHEVEHPQLGMVEIGGSAQTFGRVPPSFLLEEELHRNMAFTFYHAECMPLLQLGELVVEKLPDNLVRVRVPVENHGVIPTRIGHDQRHNISPWNTVSLEGGGLKVVAAGVAENPNLDLVRWQEGDPGTLRLETVPGLSQVVVEFLVEGRGMARVRATAVRGGEAEISRRIP